MNLPDFSLPIILINILFGSISCSVNNSGKNGEIEQKNLSSITVGSKVPAYSFKNVLNSNVQSISIDEYSGKPVLIEFWATWCSPCLPAMKKLDSLQQQFQGKIEVITVSAEHKDRLENYIKNTNTRLPVAIDSFFYQAVPTNGIPTTVLIDQLGIVKAITHPANINTEIINKLIAGEELALKREKEISKSIVINKIVGTEYQILLKSQSPSKGMEEHSSVNSEGKKNGYIYYNHALPSLFQKLFDIPTYYRLFYRDGLVESDFYNNTNNNNIFTLILEFEPQFEEKTKQKAIDFLNRNYDITGKKSIDSVECFLLTVSDNILKESTTEKEDYQFRGPELIAKKQKMERLALYIEMMQRIIVIDKTGLEGLYDLDLKWEFEKPETLHRELAKYGLELKKSETTLPIEIVEIYKK
ncbi:redoxin domain-containing protein [Flexithrix dorotheae]|uniref:redoxin domain-containing protein n=1 Tax=Flexithrix dorotheae TaxID=70993 RepID=UPI000368AFA7|nr:redoxin domain-containing protein [Flexithrix dorotheae]